MEIKQVKVDGKIIKVGDVYTTKFNVYRVVTLTNEVVTVRSVSHNKDNNTPMYIKWFFDKRYTKRILTPIEIIIRGIKPS